MRAVVREGAGEDTLDVALGHIPGTALPGQPGNVGIAGHRDTLFRGLRKIEKNDVIEFQTPAGSYSYKVESTEIVKPEDVGVLDASEHPEMTLVTCYPFYYVGAAPSRFIVKARLITEPDGPGHCRPAREPSGRTKRAAFYPACPPCRPKSQFPAEREPKAAKWSLEYDSACRRRTRPGTEPVSGCL